MDEVGLTVESILQFGAGAGIVTAAVAVIRWYQRLAAVGEETWVNRLNQLESDYNADRERWIRDRDRHDKEMGSARDLHARDMAAVREQLARCVDSRDEMEALVAQLRADHDDELTVLRTQIRDLQARG